MSTQSQSQSNPAAAAPPPPLDASQLSLVQRFRDVFADVSNAKDLVVAAVNPDTSDHKTVLLAFLDLLVCSPIPLPVPR
jgi:hypothetical protein